MRRKALFVQAMVACFTLQALSPQAMGQAAPSGATAPKSAPASPAPGAGPSAPAAPATTPPAPPSLADTLSPSARASYDAARLLYGDADYGGALLKFQQAYDEAKDARLLWNMASCEEKLRHYSKASTLIKRYLAEAKDLPAQDKVEAYELTQTLAAFTASLVVTADQPGVEITIDGEATGTTPLSAPVVVDQGTRRIVAKKAGYEDLTEDHTVAGGVPVTVTLKMVKVVHEGRVTVVTTGEHDTIAIDGAVVGQHRFEGPVQSGGHELLVTGVGMKPYRSELTITDGDKRTLSVTLESDSKGVPWWLIGTLVGAAVIGGGAVGGYFIFKPSQGQAPVGTLSPGTVQVSSIRPSLGRH